MTSEEQLSPWLCHVCDRTFHDIESTVCSICYKTTCSDHLQRIARFNPNTGLYELQPVCLFCAGIGQE